MPKADEALDRIWQRAGLAPERCLACDVCCRFASPTASFVPFFTAAEACDSGFRISDFGFAESQGGSPDPGVRPLVEPDGEWWRCPFRGTTSQACTVYDRRPLDCRLYPFVLMFDPEGKEVWLGLDEVCPFALEDLARRSAADLRVGDAGHAWRQAIDQATALLDGPLADAIAAAPGIVSCHQDHIFPLRVLPGLTRRVCRSDLGLARLVATSQEGLRDFFGGAGTGTRPYGTRPTPLAGHAFPAVYLWADLFNIHWRVEADCLLVFAESDGVSFLIAPPLGKGDVAKALRVAAEVMAAINGPRGGARAQEVDEELLPAFRAAGWQIGHRAQEYVCETASLIELRGRHFDGRRHDIHRFEKLCPGAVWRPYAPADFPACVALLRRWQRERATAHPDPFYRDQLEAAGSLHLRALREAEALGLCGCVVETEAALPASSSPLPLGEVSSPLPLRESVSPLPLGEGRVRAPGPSAAPPLRPLTPPSPKGRGEGADGPGRSIVAYTFGFPLLDSITFADFLEVADLSYPGLAAWTFHRFCREARNYPWLNLGTDSELPSLARAKLACRPSRIVSSYILNSPRQPW